MYDMKSLRTELRSILVSVAGWFPVVYAIDKKGEDHYIVFNLQDMPSLDFRNQLELELNIIVPASDSESAEEACERIIERLDHSVTVADTFVFYVYKNTVNRVDGSDPHTVRVRCTFDVYLYERNE